MFLRCRPSQSCPVLPVPSRRFCPPFWARNAWFMNCGARLWPGVELGCLGFETNLHTIGLQDSDRLAVTLHRHIYPPIRPKPMVVLVHGLGGDQDSAYVRRTALSLMQCGHEVCRVNLRGCGPGKDIAVAFCHAGRSEDLHSVFRWLRGRCEHEMLLVGFSLGANIVLKYLAESMERTPVAKALVISSPVDLHASVQALAKTPFRAMERYFVRLLVNQVQALHQAHPLLGAPPTWSSSLSVEQFDERYTAPRAGFKSALHYYQSCSSGPFLAQIRVPTRFVWARDDAFIDQASLDQAAQENRNPHLEFLPQRYGGHAAFLDLTSSGPSRFWLTEHIVAWASESSE